MVKMQTGQQRIYKMRISDFVKQFYPHALKNQKATGVPALVTLAQAALESGWGKRAPGLNFFGIKAGSSWKGKTQLLWTSEVIDGQRLKIQDKFRSYDSALDSFKDHAELLKRRFSKAFVHQDPIKFITAVQKDHGYVYATDPDYIDKIANLIHLIKRNMPANEPDYSVITPDPKPKGLDKIERRV